MTMGAGKSQHKNTCRYRVARKQLVQRQWHIASVLTQLSLSDRHILQKPLQDAAITISVCLLATEAVPLVWIDHELSRNAMLPQNSMHSDRMRYGANPVFLTVKQKDWSRDV